MPITTRAWSRAHAETVGMSPDIWNNPHVAVAPDTTTAPWTLLRTRCSWNLRAVADGSAGLPPDWWIFSTVRLGLKFSPDGSLPGFAPDDLSPDVLAVQQLRPSVVTLSPTAGTASGVVWSQPLELDIKTERRGAPNLFSAVYAFIWGTDTFSVLHGTRAGCTVEGSIELAALWGQ